MRDGVTNQQGQREANPRFQGSFAMLTASHTLNLLVSLPLVVSIFRTSRGVRLRGCQKKNPGAMARSGGRKLWSWWEEGKNEDRWRFGRVTKLWKSITWHRSFNGLRASFRLNLVLQIPILLLVRGFQYFQVCAKPCKYFHLNIYFHCTASGLH